MKKSLVSKVKSHHWNRSKKFTIAVLCFWLVATGLLVPQIFNASLAIFGLQNYLGKIVLEISNIKLSTNVMTSMMVQLKMRKQGERVDELTDEGFYSFFN